MATAFQLTRSAFGRYHVSYHCPKCGESLRSPLAEAGKPDTCPNCNTGFIVPGAEDLRQLTEAKEADARRKREQAEQRREAKQREREARLKEREEKSRCPRCGKPTSILNRDFATGLCVSCKREQDEAVRRGRHNAAPTAAPTTPNAVEEESANWVGNEAEEVKVKDPIEGASAFGGGLFVIAGVVLCCTGIGAVIGVPLIVIGALVSMVGSIAEIFLGGPAKGLKGNCPWCGTQITTLRLPGIDCSVCKKRIVIKGNKFVKIE